MPRIGPMRRIYEAHGAYERERDRWLALRMQRKTMAALVAPPPRAFASFGRDSWIVPPARVRAPECIHIGERVLIAEHGWLDVRRMDGEPEPVLTFGDDTNINRFVDIVCCASVTFGKGVLLADRVYISDVDYPPDAAGRPRGAEGGDPRPVVIEDGVFLGAGAVVKPGVTIGKHSYVSAASIVTEDVAERTLVAGAPARAVRRWEAAPGGEG